MNIPRDDTVGELRLCLSEALMYLVIYQFTMDQLATSCRNVLGRGVKPAFHDTDTDILATILARMSVSVSWNARFNNRA